MKGDFQNAIADCSEAIRLDPKDGGYRGGLAWLLATCPDARFRDPNRAVELAREAVRLAPEDGAIWNTLGVAEYGAGHWKEAIDALKKSEELHSGGDGYDWFFLAMAHWQLDDKKEAQENYDKAAEWMEKNEPDDEELCRFRGEAAELLGISEELEPKDDSPPSDEKEMPAEEVTTENTEGTEKGG